MYSGWRKQVEPDLPKESESYLTEPDSTSQQPSLKIEKSKTEVKTESTTEQEQQPDSTTVDTPTTVAESEGTSGFTIKKTQIEFSEKRRRGKR